MKVCGPETSPPGHTGPQNMSSERAPGVGDAHICGGANDLSEVLEDGKDCQSCGARHNIGEFR